MPKISRITIMGLPGRFWAKVRVPADLNGCWEWTAAKDAGGYGAFGVKKVPRRAHRVAYQALVGPIASGLQLDHLCRVRHCVNPAHLEPVTARENVLRSQAPTSLNAKKTHCPQGHAYDAANTYLSPQGSRECRTCKRVHTREASRRYMARKRAAAKAAQS